MELWYFQKGFNYSQDGPGNRLVYHLCGCNLSCPWCANPEGMRSRGPKARCAQVAEIAQAVCAAKPMFFEGGGLTLTGGEPTVQYGAVAELLRAVRAQDVRTCIETNATHPRLSELFPLLDTLIADFKHPISAEHLRWTGMGNEQIAENLRAASAYGLPMQIRVPLIHHVNDDENALEHFVSFFASINRPGMTVEFLRYHEYGKDKWAQTGRAYQMKDAFVSAERARRFEDACRNAGIPCIKT